MKSLEMVLDRPVGRHDEAHNWLYCWSLLLAGKGEVKISMSGWGCWGGSFVLINRMTAMIHAFRR